jgi:3-methyladenine DNA glycosylase AlkC
MTAKVPLKEQALNANRVTRISREVHSVCPAFAAEAFTREVMADLPRLELKDRIARVSRALHTHLPVTGPEALEVLLRSLPPTPEAAGVTNDFGLHIYSPHSDYAARYCRSVEYLDHALAALKRLTCYFTAEVAVRHFLTDFPDKTMKAVEAWARDDDHRVRRLASESTRPKLPWAPRIALPIDAALPVLDQLYADSSKYVIRSVANHLHDVSVDQPDLVLTILQRWKDARRATDRNFAFIAREALRSRLKQGWPPAYAFLGYASDAPIEVSPLSLERTQLIEGDTLAFSATLTARASAAVHVMYVISSTTQRGAPRERVYFLTRTTAEPDHALPLAKPHMLRSTATMKLIPGPHTIALQVNGRRFPAVPFQVLKA